MAYIYVIKNDINDKVYVGKTTLKIQERFKEHLRDYKKTLKEHRPLYSAMKKYGEEHF
jgi:group I intron endonuclease